MSEIEEEIVARRLWNHHAKAKHPPDGEYDGRSGEDWKLYREEAQAVLALLKIHPDRVHLAVDIHENYWEELQRGRSRMNALFSAMDAVGAEFGW